MPVTFEVTGTSTIGRDASSAAGSYLAHQNGTRMHPTQHLAHAVKGISRLLTTGKLADAVTLLQSALDDIDGFPITPQPGTPHIYVGLCRDVDVHRPGNICGWARPCPHHDTPVTLTTVEAAAIARGRQTDHVAKITAKTRKIAELTDDLENYITAILPKPERILCNGGLNRDGQIVWGTADCGRLADADGLCDAHIEAERVWRAATGKPERVIERRPPTKCRRCDRDATPGRLDGLCNADRMADSRQRKAS